VRRHEVSVSRRAVRVSKKGAAHAAKGKFDRTSQASRQARTDACVLVALALLCTVAAVFQHMTLLWVTSSKQ